MLKDCNISFYGFCFHLNCHLNAVLKYIHFWIYDAKPYQSLYSMIEETKILKLVSNVETQRLLSFGSLNTCI